MQNTPVHNSLSIPRSHLLSLHPPATLITTYHYVASQIDRGRVHSMKYKHNFMA